MRFNEVESSRQAENDEYGKWDIDDTRRPKLTLKHINKMRKMRELKKTEHSQEVQQYKAMYSSQQSE